MKKTIYNLKYTYLDEETGEIVNDTEHKVGIRIVYDIEELPRKINLYATDMQVYTELPLFGVIEYISDTLIE